MELAQKGATAEVSGVKQAKVTLKWTTAADFDLAAAYKKKDGTTGLVYFGEMGNLNAFPFMALDQDAAVGDTGGDNEENLRITNIDEMESIWLICWDYGAVKDGRKARFADSDVALTLMTGPDEINEVTLDSGDMGNVCVVAQIDNSNPMGAQLRNLSIVDTYKGLSNSGQIFATIENG